MLHSEPRSPSDVDATRIDVVLVAILLLALAFRLYRIDAPFIDAHSWRQVTNADIARHFADGSLNIFEPRVSWGGRDGLVGMEFPLLQWLTGLVWRVASESAALARTVAIAFSVFSVWLLYVLGARLFGWPAGRAAAFFMAVSPGVVFFGRSLLSDTPMLTFSIAAVLAWDIYFERGHARWAWWGATATALAGLVKLPAILVLAPIVGLAWSRRRLRAFRDVKLIVGIAGAMLVVAGWYLYADSIYQRTGLTQAVFRPSSTYPPDIAPGVVFTPVSHWATRDRVLSLDFWSVMVDRMWGLFLTPYGFLAAMVGFAIAFRRSHGVSVHLWALAGFMLLVVAAEGQYWHEFHTLPLVLPLILYAGVAAAPLFDGRAMAGHTRLGRWTIAAVVASALVFVSIQTFRGSGALRYLYRLQEPDVVFLSAGEAVRSMTEDAPLITVDYEQIGTNSPMMLYFARRQGWSFDGNSISAHVIEHLRSTKGARYFVTTCWLTLRDRKPDVVEYLSRYRVIAPPKSWPDDYRVVDLR